MARGGQNQHEVARKKLENQPTPTPGAYFSGWRDAFERLACRYPYPFEVNLE